MDFERERQTLETRNEIAISLIRGAMILLVFGFHLANYEWHIIPLVTPGAFVAYMSTAVLASLGLVVYLRRNPPYHPARKYLLGIGEIAFFTGAFFAMGFGTLENFLTGIPIGAAAAHGMSREATITLIPVPVLCVLISLSALRYSERLVLLVGGFSLLSYLAVVFTFAPVEFRLGAVFMGTTLLTTISVGTAYTVRGMIELHQAVVRKSRLARFLPPELVERMADHPELLEQQTEQRVATILFTDIRGFTTLSEQMAPQEVVDFLNMFLEEMTDAVMDHHGMLDKYIGDCVMGVYGVPFANEGHALHAVETAIDMCRRLGGVNRRLVAQGKRELGIGIGIHTGPVVIGALGSSRRLDYTVIGDAVNVASRIEGMTRKYPHDILLSDITREAVGDAIPMREVDTVLVKGRAQPVKLWTPVLDGTP